MMTTSVCCAVQTASGASLRISLATILSPVVTESEFRSCCKPKVQVCQREDLVF